MNDSSATPTVDARIKIRNLFERVWKRKQTNERTIRNRQATRTDIGLLVVAGARKWKNEKKNVGRNRDRVENSFVNALLHITHVVGSRKRSRSPAHGCAKQEKKAKQNYIYSFSLHLRNVNLYPIGKLAYVGPPTYLHSMRYAHEPRQLAIHRTQTHTWLCGRYVPVHIVNHHQRRVTRLAWNRQLAKWFQQFALSMRTSQVGPPKKVFTKS